MTSPTPTPKPKRGAPYGNKNRQRHGRYAHPPLNAATPTGAISLSSAPSPTGDPAPPNRLTLTSEISYLRAHMLRAAIIAASTSNVAETKDMLRTLCLAATTLTRLIQTENWLSQTTGAQVQIDDRPSAIKHLQRVFTAAHPPKQPRLASAGDQQDDQDDEQEDDRENDSPQLE